MAAAEATKKSKGAPPIAKLNKLYEDDSFDLNSLYNGYYKDLGENFEAAWETIQTTCNEKKMTMQHLAYSQTWAQAWSFLASAIPLTTGCSLFFLPANAYASYAISLYDASYPQNPKFADATVSGGKFNGLLAHAWSVNMEVTQEDLTTKLQKVDANDNTIIGKLIGYKESSGKAVQMELSKMKFDFACNKYKVIKAEFQGDQFMISASGNQECIMFFKAPEGILGVNWATKEYKGDRFNVGSLNGYSSAVQSFYNELVERELLTGEKFE